MIALEAHAAWYIRRFGECKPEWFVFPAGKGQPNDPTKPVTTLSVMGHDLPPLHSHDILRCVRHIAL